MNFNCSILFKNNICNYTSNWNNYGRWSVTINVRDDKYVFQPLESGVKIKRNGSVLNLNTSNYDKKYKPGFYNQINAFVNLIKNKRNQWPDVNLSDLTSIFSLIKNILLRNILIIGFGNIGYRHYQSLSANNIFKTYVVDKKKYRSNKFAEK